MSSLFVVVDAANKGFFGKLTRSRVPGAIPFGGKYRLIDFTLSNCKNSHVTNVGIFPYGYYRSLSDHIGSGDRWDLNRRKDGVFILPPKNLILTIEDSLSFRRMYEHLEYFKRSSQEYVLVTPANLVWNIDYQVLLHQHLITGADLTEVLSAEQKRIRTFILAKKLLLDYILNADTIPYRNLTDCFDYAPTIKKETYLFDAECRLVETSFDLYQANMALLNPLTRMELFKKERPIYSKETMSAAARYGKEASIDNSLIASGAVVEGRVVHSIIGRKVRIEAGAKVANSVLMNQCVVEKDASVSYAILDKETSVASSSRVEGDLNQLFVSEKKQIVVGQENLKVLQITAECHPFVKVGGLADVVASLSDNFTRLGVEAFVMMPLYRMIEDKYKAYLENKAEQIIDYGGEKFKVTLHYVLDQNVNYYFIEAYDFFDRPKIYGYEDDGDRFAFFAKAAVAFLDIFEALPDIIHIHDWHLGLIPLLLKADSRYEDIQTLITIHNIEYQGIHSAEILKKLGLNVPFQTQKEINFLALGMTHATKLSTVSETYREELKFEYYSKNLVDIINRRDRDFYGILNGISDEIGPNRDLTIARKYNLMNVFSAKKENKANLQKRMALSIGNDYFLMGMVSRIVEQKGFELLIPALEELLQDPSNQFVLLGTGEEHFKERLERLKERFPDQVALNLEYNATEPSYIYAGADVFLMPSRYEPCGTSQMIALKYGTIPIVRQTGGLNDTIEAFDPITKRGNGFKFYNYDERDLLFQVRHAKQLYLTDRSSWQQLIINAMNSHFWEKDCALAYVSLYRQMLAKPLQQEGTR
ncbi:MAG: glycogen/starch synthase [Candidatus Izemoplasmatales bacterium]|nr:glycogen/starch synthase [Candidatus Izemoplasmatales bacterium]